MDIDEVFKRAAKARSTDAESYKREIALTIDRCYDTDDPKVLAELEKLFPEKPSPEQFIKKLVYMINKKMQS